MKQILKQLAFALARSKPGGWMIWFILRYFPFLIPYKKLYQDELIIVIPHPLPSYPTHTLLLSRIYLPDFLALDVQSETGNKFVQSVFQALESLCEEKIQTNFQLIINGGEFQDVSLLHMHWIENNPLPSPRETMESEYTSDGFTNLITLTQIKLQNTAYSAYRLNFTFHEESIQLYLQVE